MGQKRQSARVKASVAQKLGHARASLLLEGSYRLLRLLRRNLRSRRGLRLARSLGSLRRHRCCHRFHCGAKRARVRATQSQQVATKVLLGWQQPRWGACARGRAAASTPMSALRLTLLDFLLHRLNLVIDILAICLDPRVYHLV